MEKTGSINIIVVDDHEFFRKGLVAALLECQDINVVAQVRNGEEAINCILGFNNEINYPFVILMDLETKKDKESGIRATKVIINIEPRIKVVALTTFSSERMIMTFLNVGGIGFLDKIADIEEIVYAVRKAAKGEQYIAKDIIANYLSYINKTNNNEQEIHLPPKLLELLKLCEAGKKYKEVAEETNRTLNTIHTHASRIRNYFGVDSMAKAIKIARERKII